MKRGAGGNHGHHQDDSSLTAASHAYCASVRSNRSEGEYTDAPQQRLKWVALRFVLFCALYMSPSRSCGRQNNYKTTDAPFFVAKTYFGTFSMKYGNPKTDSTGT